MDSRIKQIKDFCDQYSQNHFVISCRTAAYEGDFSRFTEVTIAEFDDEQIELFIKQWFSSKLDDKTGTAQKLWEFLQQPANTSVKELAQTPLLLTFLCLVYDRSQSLPAVRSILYGKALDILLEEWAAEKRIEQAPIYQGLHTELEKLFLSEIAYQSFKDKQLFFSEQSLTKKITVFLANNLGAPKHLDGAAVLKAIELQQGILVKRAENIYSFSHLTLQKYLTARYISREILIEELVSKYLTDSCWREIFLLVSGLQDSSDNLLLAMEQQAHTLIQSPKLQGLLKWLMELGVDSQSSYGLLASRAWLLESALIIGANHIPNFIANVRSFTNGIASSNNSIRAININVTRASANARASVINIASNITEARARTRVRAIASAIASANASVRFSDINVDFEALARSLEELANQIPADADDDVWNEFSHQLTQIYLDTFHLDITLITVILDDTKIIGRYLDTVKLIIDCKNSAMTVSKKQWKAIELRLLTVPNT